MAHLYAISQSQLLRNGFAINDHYCPKESSCRHAVIDTYASDQECEESMADEELLRLLYAGSGRYSPECADSYQYHEQERSVVHDNGSSMRGYEDMSKEHEFEKIAQWEGIASTKSAGTARSDYQVPHKLPAEAHEREEAKVERALIRQLAHDSSSTHNRLAHVESYAKSNAEYLAERCDGLTEVCMMFNQQFILLMRQYDHLLAIVERQPTKSRLRQGDVDDRTRVDARRLTLNIRDPGPPVSRPRGMDFNIGKYQHSMSPASNVSSPLSHDSGVFLLERGDQSQTRPCTVKQASRLSKKRKASHRGAGLSKTAKQRRN